jgi:hypothetical protein
LGSKKRYLKTKKITLIQQAIALRAAYPDGEYDIEKRKKLIWRGKIRPTPISQEYAVLLTWEPGLSPKVWVIGDELQKLDDPDFPHKFEINIEKKKARLCLYRHQEFSSYKYLSKTIIPWIIEWLYFYEVWLATGEWCGGGDHPKEGDKKDD